VMSWEQGTTANTSRLDGLLIEQCSEYTHNDKNFKPTYSLKSDYFLSTTYITGHVWDYHSGGSRGGSVYKGSEPKIFYVPIFAFINNEAMHKGAAICLLIKPAKAIPPSTVSKSPDSSPHDSQHPTPLFMRELLVPNHNASATIMVRPRLAPRRMPCFRHLSGPC
jgi:hypothetical protein